ncbi:unnamed protein product, partial [Polarella glacialis]
VMNISASDLQIGFVLGTHDSFGMMIYEKIRPRWWYVALIDCDGVERTIDYAVHQTNIKRGWLEEFPMDRCTPASLSFFTALYMVQGAFQAFAIVKKSNFAATKHPIRVMLGSTIFTAASGMLLFVLDALWFASHGEDQPVMYMAAKFLKSLSKHGLFAILMLLSEGRCISRELLVADVIRWSLLLAPFLAAGLCLELWGENAQSRKYTTDSIYSTWVGAALLLADLCLLVQYVRNIMRSHASESDFASRAFYRGWGNGESVELCSLFPVGSAGVWALAGTDAVNFQENRQCRARAEVWHRDRVAVHFQPGTQGAKGP